MEGSDELKHVIRADADLICIRGHFEMTKGYARIFESSDRQQRTIWIDEMAWLSSFYG